MRGAWIFLLALALRGLYLFEVFGDPGFHEPRVDSETYDRLARALLAGEGWTAEYFWQPPFYPVTLAVSYALTGGSILGAKLIQAVCGAATCLLTVRLGDRLCDRTTGTIAGVVLACYGPLIFFDGELLATCWACMISVGMLLLLLLARERRGASMWLGVGACGALATLIRPTFLPFVIAAGVWSCTRGATPRQRVAWGACLLAGFLVVVGPVTVASKRVADRLSFLPASGAINLYVGNNPQAFETTSIRPGSSWSALTRLPRLHGVERRADTPGFFRERVKAYVLDDPVGFAVGIGRKTVEFVSSRELPRNLDVYVERDGSRLLRASVWKLGRFGFPFGLLLPLAAVGLVVHWRRLPAPVLLWLALYPAAVILVFVSARYRMPVVPVLAILAVAGTRAIVSRTRTRIRIPVASSVIIGTLLVSTLPGPHPAERIDYRAERLYLLGSLAARRGEDALALGRLQAAVELDPAHGDAHNTLGTIHARRRDLDRALEHLERAVTINPESVLARENLGRVLEALGRHRDALEQYRAALELEPYNESVRRRAARAERRAP